jgi:hypothetical protein
MNTHVRDNFNALKAPPTAQYEFNEGADYTTTSTSFVDVDATDLALSITTTGGDVLFSFTGNLTFAAAGNLVYFDIYDDGAAARLGGDDGIAGLYLTLTTAANKPGFPFSFTHIERNVSAGSKTYKLQWKVGASTITMYAGAGTATADVHGEFFAREV